MRFSHTEDPPETRRVMRLSISDGIFAVQYSTLTAGPFLTAFLVAIGAGSFMVGLAASLPLLGGLAQPLGAELIRRRGGWRRGVLLVAAVVDALLWGASMAAVTWLEHDLAILVVLAVLAVQQLFAAVATSAWTSWISDLIPDRVRGRFFGTRNFVCNFFGALTAAGAGFAVRAAEDPIPVFVGLFALAVIFRLVSLHFLSRQPEPTPAHSLDGGFLAHFRTPLQDRSFRPYLVYAAGWNFAVWFVAPFFAVYMLTQAQVGVAAMMSFSAGGIVSNLIGQRVWGPLCDRHGDIQVMRMTGLSVAIQPFWWLLTASHGMGYYLMPLLSITGGFAWGGLTLATGNLTMRLAPEQGKTSYFAAAAAAGGAFGAVGPVVGGTVAAFLVARSPILPFALLEGLKSLFVLGGILRLAAWFLLERVTEPVDRPPLKAVFVIRDTVRSMNPIQGFGPLMHTFMPGTERRPQSADDSSK